MMMDQKDNNSFIVRSSYCTVFIFGLLQFYGSRKLHGGFLKQGYPQSSSIYRGIFHEIDNPAIGVPPWPWKPSHVFFWCGCESHDTSGLILRKCMESDRQHWPQHWRRGSATEGVYDVYIQNQHPKFRSIHLTLYNNADHISFHFYHISFTTYIIYKFQYIICHTLCIIHLHN